jgi:hypothetical protein
MFTCRQSKKAEVIEYRDLLPITIDVPPEQLVPVAECPADSIVFITVYREVLIQGESENATELVPPDTVYIIDTLASLSETVRDWNIKRDYRTLILDDSTIGLLHTNVTVHQNRLVDHSASFTPVQKTITRVKTERIIPYGRLTYGPFDQVGIGGGAFIGRTGFDISYVRDFKEPQNGLSFGFMIRF